MKKILLDLGEEIHHFQTVIFEIDMPTVDIDAFLSQFFDCFMNENAIKEKVTVLIHDAILKDTLFESLIEDDGVNSDQRLRVCLAIVRLVEGTKMKIAPIDPYIDGLFSYRFERLLNDNTVVLAKV